MNSLLKKIIEQYRKALDKAITLEESSLHEHKIESDELIQNLVKKKYLILYQLDIII